MQEDLKVPKPNPQGPEPEPDPGQDPHLVPVTGPTPEPADDSDPRRAGLILRQEI